MSFLFGLSIGFVIAVLIMGCASYPNDRSISRMSAEQLRWELSK